MHQVKPSIDFHILNIHCSAYKATFVRRAVSTDYVVITYTVSLYDTMYDTMDDCVLCVCAHKASTH